MTNICTHDGVFHADDVYAIAMLSLLSDEPVNIKRSRLQADIDEADIVVDVGGVYAPDEGRFDHHQRGFDECRPNGVMYSSFGLVFKEFAHRVMPAEVAAIVDRDLVQIIDAVDNGQGDLAKGNFGYSDIIGGFNPTWNEPYDHDMFEEAVDLASRVLANAIRSAWGVVTAREVVRNADKLLNGQVLLMDQFCPWQEEVISNHPEVLFVLFPDKSGDWRIQTVPESVDSFKSRKPLPEAWAGLRGSAFNAVTGISDGVFCHNGRFIAGAESKQSVIRLAELAL